MDKGDTTTTGSMLDDNGKLPQRRIEDRATDEMRGGRKALAAINIETHSPEAIQKIVHQLQVHHIELEMQNEELIRTQWELESSRIRYFDLYDLAPVGYFTLSEHGLIVEANLMAAKMFGCGRKELVNKAISSLIYRVDQDVYYLNRQKLFTCRDPQSYEIRIVDIHGAPLWVHVAATAVKDVDDVTLIRMVITDISERKQVEHTLRESEERYRKEQQRLDNILHNSNIELANATTLAEKASAVAEKANLAKSDFLSNMSHELRTPLSAILGFAQLIDTGNPPLTPQQKRSVDQILRAGWYLLDLINEILDLALIESGKLSISLEPVSLSKVLRDCQTMIEPLAEKHRIQVSFTDIEANYFVTADGTRLKQVIVNLMSNAIKYNKKNGTVVVSCIQTSSERLRVCVEDSGEGLLPEQVAQLFQSFNRLGQEHKSEQGTGIGLVMTKRLIELMDGEIGLESNPGEGSNFWIEINLAPHKQINTKKPGVHALEKSLKDSQTALQTLLYVEDDAANLMLVEDIVARREDIFLITAPDSLSGIELARVEQPQIILMDINLPGMNGVTALKILLEDPLTKDIPVIALSANAIPTDIEQSLRAGFFRYLTKPIKIDEFLTTIDTALKFAAETRKEKYQ